MNLDDRQLIYLIVNQVSAVLDAGLDQLEKNEENTKFIKLIEWPVHPWLLKFPRIDFSYMLVLETLCILVVIRVLISRRRLNC